MALAARLGEWMYTAVARRKAAGEEMQVVARERWERDEEAKACAVCRQPFVKVCSRGAVSWPCFFHAFLFRVVI